MTTVLANCLCTFIRRRGQFSEICYRIIRDINLLVIFWIQTSNATPFTIRTNPLEARTVPNFLPSMLASGSLNAQG